MMADTHASPAGYVQQGCITHGDSMPEGVPMLSITKADYPATIFAMNLIRMDSGGPSWPAEDAPQVPLCWHPFLPVIEAALNELDGGDRSKVDLDTEMFTFCAGEEGAMSAIRERSQALGMASLFLNDFFEGWSYFATEALRPTEARTGGDALPHPITPELIAGIGRGDIDAQGKAMDILEHLRSNPTPADDARTPDDVVERATMAVGRCVEGPNFDPFADPEATDFAEKIARAALTASGDARESLRAEIINTPETADFMAGVPLEAAHQRERWGADHDAGKTPLDWFWLIGYLAQKAAFAAMAGDAAKAMHHTISTAAALANWHAALSGKDSSMRPGIDDTALLSTPPAQEEGK